jgi:endonuclease/exonuclease/phosphatase family metal-dependent hydrolase
MRTFVRCWLLFIVAVHSATLPAQETPLRVATWNVAWLTNEPVENMAVVKACEAQNSADVPFEEREPVVCQQGRPFRMAGAFANLAANARHFDFDIVALQEVQGLGAMRYLFGDLKAVKSIGKEGPPPGTYALAVNPEGGRQRVGIAVRAALLAPGKTLVATPYTELGAPLDRDKRSGLDVMIPLKSGPLRVMVVHLKSGCQRSPLDSTGKDEPACGPLSKQAPILKRWIDLRKAEGVPFMVMGDFNRVLTPGSSHEQCPAQGACDRRALLPWLDANGVDTAPILIPTALVEHGIGCFTQAHGANLIDHLILGGGAESGYVAGSVKSHNYVDPKTMEPILDKKKTGLYSDHCPVSIVWSPERR